MKLELVMHANQMSLDTYTKADGKVYCRKNNEVMITTMKDCQYCPYFRGAERGDYVMCEWKDAAAPHSVRHIGYGKAEEEYKRVDELIRLGVLE